MLRFLIPDPFDVDGEKKRWQSPTIEALDDVACSGVREKFENHFN
jgi:hypothetical protein